MSSRAVSTSTNHGAAVVYWHLRCLCPRNTVAVARHLLRDDAVRSAAGAIVTGELEPGEKLHDEELCKWLGLSRTPVREALARLHDERLVEVAPQRRTRVAPLAAEEASDTFLVLASLHALATELAVRDGPRRAGGEGPGASRAESYRAVHRCATPWSAAGRGSKSRAGRWLARAWSGEVACMSSGDADAVVIGAGPNGLVAANLLADAGWDVVVCEAEREPGGAVRSGELLEAGFVHDRFSSFYPFAAISPVLDLQEHGLRWRRAPLALGNARSDGTATVVSDDLDETASGLDVAAPGDGDAWRRLMERWARLAPGFAQAFFTPFPPVRGAVRLAGAMDSRDFLRLARELLLAVRRLADEHFRGRGPADVLSGTALHADLAPEAVGSGAFGWNMCGLGQRHGFSVPEGGSGRLFEALAGRLVARGGSLCCGARVERVLVRGGRARGVRPAGGEQLRVRRAVVADVGAPTLHAKLLDADELPRRLLDDLSRSGWDSATVKIVWTLERPIPWAAPELRRAGTVPSATASTI